MVFFSIVMPVYNRASFVGRAIRSCLSQSFNDFEIVVIDDGSKDESVNVIRSFDDPRVRLLVQQKNRGRCPARNTSMEASRGEWLVFLDSDDELLDGALESIHRDATSVSPDVVALRFMCVDDCGRTSPEPSHRGERWTFEQFLHWLDRSMGCRSEALLCSRASTFPSVRFPEGHAEEGLYNLDLARAGRVLASDAVVRLYHHDARNQVTRPDCRRTLRWASDAATNVDVVVEKHGDAIAQHAPAFYAFLLRDGALQHFLAGHRRGGLRFARLYVQFQGMSAKMSLIVSLGLIGPVPLAVSQSLQGMIRFLFARSARRELPSQPR